LPKLKKLGYGARIATTTRHTDGEEEIGRESDGAAADYPDGKRKPPTLEVEGSSSLEKSGIYNAVFSALKG
jgi:hypothetical protein